VDWKDAEPDAYDRHVFRFRAGRLGRAMQAVAEAVLLPPGKSLDPRDFFRVAGLAPNCFDRLFKGLFRPPRAAIVRNYVKLVRKVSRL
jgi:hypothetical protein